MNPSPYPPCVTRPSACSPVLPPELCDYILDHCYDDKATLCAGSLVSRSFNATCRYHIFSKNIDISNAPGARKSPRSSGKTPEEKESLVNKDHGAEEEAKTKSAINPKSSAGSFVRMVLTPSSTLAPFLQELSLVLRPATLSSWATIVRGKDVSASAWLDELLALLPATSAAATSVETKHNPFHLRTLRIFRHGVDLSPFALTALQQNFSSITTLAFFETTLQKRSLKKDIEWVCGFENLEDLLFYGHHRGERKIDATGGHGGEGMTIAEVDAGMPWGWSPPGHSFDLNDAVNIEGETTIRLPQRIRRLRLDLPGPALEAVMQWLLAHAPPSLKDKDGQERQGCVFSTGRKFPSVSALHIFRVMEDEAPMLRAYLRACKDTLEDLMLFLYQRTTTRGKHLIPGLSCAILTMSGANRRL
ncbi:hypothetical protein GYMLUDRAFT_57858 [Collybiopsis luxurians FD-317 M1]|uniref:Uncharacterized protein n=1 Tax=Collybiopsis luxurians FD-317 M1 TaxID=944289 RepID=A0A0D0CUD1_9AGAR|nr:hypothetical protein GYMLUDRAFT_57858 [Collybiopsis luxurians FD-317 M1]